MRRIREAVLPFTWNSDDLPKTVREYREKYKGVSRIMDDHSEILELAHEDLRRLSSGSRKGREADFTSETILRAWWFTPSRASRCGRPWCRSPRATSCRTSCGRGSGW